MLSGSGEVIAHIQEGESKVSMSIVIEGSGTDSRTEHVLEGIPASGGIAIASARILAEEEEASTETHELDDEEVEMELVRFSAALVEADKVLEQIEMMAREDVRDRAEIFEALRMILSDPTLSDSINTYIRNHRTSARNAITTQMGGLAEIFTAAADETMRSRAEDIRALQSHLISCLLKTPVDHQFHNDAVLVLTSLSPGDTVLYARNKAAAFVLESGGINSHSAILARAFGIPMVACIKGAARYARPHAPVIVDGYNGKVIIDPEPATVERYRRRKEELEAQRAQLGTLRELPAETRDAERIAIAANLDMVDELANAMENGAEEIGLMRTEYLVMGRDTDVSMEEQLQYYRQLAERAYPLRVTFRLFDIGSEKLGGEIWGRSSSPLGLRGSRLLLLRREILVRQVEAIMRASTMKNLQMMMPMVTSVDEVLELKRVVFEVCERLRGEGIAFDENMKVGAMIETPAAAIMADALARGSDFLSLGTNDLAQYTLAVDRSDDALTSYYDELHPAVLRLVRASAVAAARAGIPITICGELAANPLATELLIGLGLRRFSVQPPELASLKHRIRGTDSARARELARRAIRLATGGEVREMLNAEL
jgi:phosphotransferase system enzyme I (PtsI)